MLKINLSDITNILWSTLMGMVSFLISGIMSSLLILYLNNYILGTIVAGGVGGLLLGLFNYKQRMVGKMALAGLISQLIGFLGSFILVEALVGGFELLFPSVAARLNNFNVADIFVIILMGAVFGVTFGKVVYGSKSIKLFSIICSVVSIPFAILIGAMNSGHWIKVWLENSFIIFGKLDINFLIINLEFGIGVGLSIGIFNLLKQKSSKDLM